MLLKDTCTSVFFLEKGEGFLYPGAHRITDTKNTGVLHVDRGEGSYPGTGMKAYPRTQIFTTGDRTFFFLSQTSTFQLLDEPWTQVSSLILPGSFLQFLSSIGLCNPTARRFFIECC